MRADQMLQELAADLAYLLKKKDVSFTCSAQPAYIKAEYDLFKTLFLNLVDNAIKAGASCITVTGYADKSSVEKSNTHTSDLRYTICIKDNGCGIPQDEIQKITEAFYMVDKSRSRKLHGAGLGLSLAQKIAEIHGSSLIFESDGKTGTSVALHLPLLSVDDSDAPLYADKTI